VKDLVWGLCASVVLAPGVGAQQMPAVRMYAVPRGQAKP
jgi:hypothetical protein